MSLVIYNLLVIIIVLLIKPYLLEANLPITSAVFYPWRHFMSMYTQDHENHNHGIPYSHRTSTKLGSHPMRSLLLANNGRQTFYVDHRRTNNQRIFLNVIPHTVPVSKLLSEDIPIPHQTSPKSFPKKENINPQTSSKSGYVINAYTKKVAGGVDENIILNVTSIPNTTSIPNRRKYTETIDLDDKNVNIHEISQTKNTTPPEVDVPQNETLVSQFLMDTEDLVNKTYPKSVFDKYVNSINQLERKFYLSTFTKLTDGGPTERRENGISFVQSGLFLHLALTSLSSTVDKITRAEIEACSNFSASEEEKVEAINQTVSWLPQSNSDLKFKWSNRLILAPGINVTKEFQLGTAKELNLHIDHLNGTDNPVLIAKILNQMVEDDSGGSMHDTFDEDELAHGVGTVLLSTMYMRSQWRSAPTLLNNTRRFYDAPEDSDLKTTRMIRINDVVGYVDLTEWDAEAIEISYATPGLSLLLVVPRGHSLRPLTQKLGANAALRDVTGMMTMRRLAVTMPLYTLRMTLLLPNKLRDMGVRRLVAESPLDNNATAEPTLRITHAVQRIMFWAEAGRNAYKEDGIEWDDSPEMELTVDRPYAFFVRWHNVTLMNGHFVL